MKRNPLLLAGLLMATLLPLAACRSGVADDPILRLSAEESLAARMERPDRDQSDSQKALEAFQDVARLYPTSEFAESARTESKRVLDNLAEHEFVVGLFYFRYGLPVAAVQRFEHLLSTYPDYSEKDKVLYHLGRAYQRQDQPEQAAAAFERLRTEFPQSRFVAEVEG